MTTHAEQKAAFLGKPLSHREHQVLLAMARGLVNSEIAVELGVSENTIKTTSVRLFIKLGVHTRSEAVAFGCHGGLIPAPAGLDGHLPPPEPPRRRDRHIRRPAAPKTTPSPCTQLHIPGGLLSEIADILQATAHGRFSAPLSRSAAQALNSLVAYADKPAIPPQRTPDSST